MLPQKEETERQREVCERSSLPFQPLRKQASSLAFSHRGLTLPVSVLHQVFVLTCILIRFSGSNSCRGLFEKCQTYANELLCLLNKLLNSQQILEINALSVVRFGRMKMDSRLINCVVSFPQRQERMKNKYHFPVQFLKKALPNLLISRFFVLCFVFRISALSHPLSHLNKQRIGPSGWDTEIKFKLLKLKY